MNPRILLLIFSFILLAVLAGWCVISRPSNQETPSPQVPVASAVSPAPSSPVCPYADSPDAAAIDTALGFLLRHKEQERPSWQVYALLDYLRRRFGLDERYSMENVFPRDVWSEYDIEMATLFQRLTDNAFRVDKARFPKEPADLNRFLARSLYCDQYPVDATFIRQLLDLYEADRAQPVPGYIATHIILACQWLRELGCDDALPELNALRPAFAELLEQIINRENAETDLAFEAMMLLYYIGEGDRVWGAWVETLRALQRPSGAWGYRPGDSDDGHPTVLALWVLLEKALPDVKKTPWLIKTP